MLPEYLELFFCVYTGYPEAAVRVVEVDARLFDVSP